MSIRTDVSPAVLPVDTVPGGLPVVTTVTVPGTRVILASKKSVNDKSMNEALESTGLLISTSYTMVSPAVGPPDMSVSTSASMFCGGGFDVAEKQDRIEVLGELVEMVELLFHLLFLVFLRFERRRGHATS